MKNILITITLILTFILTSCQVYDGTYSTNYNNEMSYTSRIFIYDNPSFYYPWYYQHHSYWLPYDYYWYYHPNHCTYNPFYHNGWSYNNNNYYGPRTHLKPPNIPPKYIKPRYTKTTQSNKTMVKPKRQERYVPSQNYKPPKTYRTPNRTVKTPQYWREFNNMSKPAPRQQNYSRPTQSRQKSTPHKRTSSPPTRQKR